MKPALIIVLVLSSAMTYADELKFYGRYQDIDNGYDAATAVGVRGVFDDYKGTKATLVLGFENKQWDVGTRNKPANNIDIAVYQNLSDAAFQVFQVQLGSSNLYPRAGFFYELDYKLPPSRNLVLGVGGGHQCFQDKDCYDAVKLGPTWYLQQGNLGHVGYRYTRYSSNGHNHTLFSEWRLSNQLSLTSTVMQGSGAYRVLLPVPTTLTEVDAMSFDVGANWKVNSLVWYAKLGQTQVDNATTGGASVYSSQDVELGVSKVW